jgi:hypothetical protein
MDDNKSFTFMTIGFLAVVALISIFGDSSMLDSESTKKFKEAEKTKQIQCQWKIDSLKATQKNK